MFKEMKELKIVDALNPESAASVKYTALSEPGITVEWIIELKCVLEKNQEIESNKESILKNKKRSEIRNK